MCLLPLNQGLTHLACSRRIILLYTLNMSIFSFGISMKGKLLTRGDQRMQIWTVPSFLKYLLRKMFILIKGNVSDTFLTIFQWFWTVSHTIADFKKFFPNLGNGLESFYNTFWSWKERFLRRFQPFRTISSFATVCHTSS